MEDSLNQTAKATRVGILADMNDRTNPNSISSMTNAARNGDVDLFLHAGLLNIILFFFIFFIFWYVFFIS